jgi:hypothetical protein
MMNDRTRRLGQHTARTAPVWATRALGPVPADPASLHDWEHKAAAIAAYRETYGYNHPRRPHRTRTQPPHTQSASCLAPGLRRSQPGRRT